MREASGYGVYFLTYEKLVQREMVKKGIQRDQISPMNAVIYGAAAGYAVSISSARLDSWSSDSSLALGSYLPHRYD